jgi:hypothetical protein
LKQQGYQIDPTTPSNSTLTYRSQSGQVVTILNDLKVIELIEAGILAQAGVYRIAPDVETLELLLEEEGVVSIFYTGPDFVNEDVAAAVTSGKHVYSYSAESISLTQGDSIVLTFPTVIGGLTGGATTAFVKFYTGFKSTTGCMTLNGGIDSDTTGVKVTTFAKGSTGTPFGSNPNAFIEYEVNEVPDEPTGDTHFKLWSGLNTQGKLKSDTTVTDSPDDTPAWGTTARETKTVADGATVGENYYSRKVFTKKAGVYTEEFHEGLTSTPNPNSKRKYFQKLFFTEVFNLTQNSANDTTLSISTLAYPWVTNWNAIDLRGGFSDFSEEGGISGSCRGMYNNGVWRSKFTGDLQLNTLEVNGDRVEYVATSTSPDEDLTSLLVEQKRTDKNGTVSINGAPIPSGLNTSYTYEFEGERCLMTHKTTDESYDCMNCYGVSGGLFNFIDSGANAVASRKASGFIKDYTIPIAAGDGFTVFTYERMVIGSDGSILLNIGKTGATQVAAGAAAREIWRTLGHVTLPDNVLMVGV